MVAAVSVRIAPAIGIRFAKTEIQHLHVAIETNHDVCGFQVAMDNARTMRCAKRLQHLPCNLEAALHGGRAFEPIAQGFALHQFRHQVVGADVVKRADIRMVERRDRPRLALEACAELFA